MVFQMVKIIVSLLGILLILGSLASVGTADTEYDPNDYYGSWAAKLDAEFKAGSFDTSAPKYDPNTGFSITSTPPGAEIFVNGGNEGITRSLKAKEILGLIPGEYNVTLSFPGYSDFAGNFTVNESEIKNIEAVLTLI